MTRILSESTRINQFSASSYGFQKNPRFHLAKKVENQALKRKIRILLLEKVLLPILKGEVQIQDVYTPPGGWDSFYNTNPDFDQLSLKEKLSLTWLLP